MIKQIIKHPNNILREVSNESNYDITLIEDLEATMQSNDGAGLSAVQIGELKRVFVTINETYVNPVIIRKKGKIGMREGCLSIPGKEVDVMRASEVVARYVNRNNRKVTKTLQGIEARVFLHEFDHLEGVLILDYE